MILFRVNLHSWHVVNQPFWNTKLKIEIELNLMWCWEEKKVEWRDVFDWPSCCNLHAWENLVVGATLICILFKGNCSGFCCDYPSHNCLLLISRQKSLSSLNCSVSKQLAEKIRTERTLFSNKPKNKNHFALLTTRKSQFSAGRLMHFSLVLVFHCTGRCEKSARNKTIAIIQCCMKFPLLSR